MPVVNDLVVPYHQQDTDYYCGAACAQMVLGSLGLGLLSQDTLYNDNHTHSTLESGWATAPDGLHWTLTNYSQGLPHAIPSNPGETVNWTTLAYHMATSEDAISRKICWTIEHYTIAPSCVDTAPIALRPMSTIWGSRSTISTSTIHGRQRRARPIRRWPRPHPTRLAMVAVPEVRAASPMKLLLIRTGLTPI
jgi:hypothetical protein